MEKQSPLMARLLLIGMAIGMDLTLGQCPVKISPKLCPTFMAAADTVYLQVRIVLDASQEDPAFFDKSKPIRERPLRTWTEELISKFDLRQLDDPKSSYVRPYSEADLVPAIDQVMYHNTSVTKANLGNLVSMPYVATVEPACWRMSVTLCTEINTRPDSTSIFFEIFFNGSIGLDTAARKDLLSTFAVRDTTIVSGTAGYECMGRGYLASPPSIRTIGKNSKINWMEPGSVNCPVHVYLARNRAIRPSPDFRRVPLRNHRLDGRANPTTRQQRP